MISFITSKQGHRRLGISRLRVVEFEVALHLVEVDVLRQGVSSNRLGNLIKTSLVWLFLRILLKQLLLPSYSLL